MGRLPREAGALPRRLGLMAGPESDARGRARYHRSFHGPRTGPPPDGSAPGASASRRPRWDTDAGITDRDVAALVWLGQQYAARSDVLRVLLGRLSPASTQVAGMVGEQTLRQILDRWQDRGL